jgi:hypothetical protein
MINPFQAMQALSNPQQFLGQQLQGRMQRMMKQNPQAYQKMQEMINGKSEAEMKQTCMNLAQQNGIDLRSFASTFGINL